MQSSTIVGIVLVILVAGVGTIVWSVAGVSRVIALLSSYRPRHAEHKPIDPARVAFLIAAHNEELVIEKTLRSAATQVALEQIFVASDGSTDATVALAESAGVNVYPVEPNRGKAGAIVAAIEYFELVDRFDVVVLLDADTVLADDYLTSGLAMFTDDDIVAVAGRASSILDPLPVKTAGKIMVTYRQRVYIAMQYLMKFGQAARSINAVTIVPGFASMYKTRILDRVDIAAPGLAIEDYNMTFEIHAKSLGRIAFNPRAAVAYTQDPDTLRDYTKQVSRWSLGFWQTVLRHPWQPRVFWVALWLHVAELVTASTMLILVLPLTLLSALGGVIAAVGIDASGLGHDLFVAMPPWVLILGVVVPDYILTIVAAVSLRRPLVLALGVVFPLLRILDAFVCLRAGVRAFDRSATGTWKSPPRRADAVPQ